MGNKVNSSGAGSNDPRAFDYQRHSEQAKSKTPNQPDVSKSAEPKASSGSQGPSQPAQISNVRRSNSSGNTSRRSSSERALEIQSQLNSFMTSVRTDPGAFSKLISQFAQSFGNLPTGASAAPAVSSNESLNGVISPPAIADETLTEVVPAASNGNGNQKVVVPPVSNGIGNLVSSAPAADEDEGTQKIVIPPAANGNGVLKKAVAAEEKENGNKKSVIPPAANGIGVLKKAASAPSENGNGNLKKAVPASEKGIEKRNEKADAKKAGTQKQIREAMVNLLEKIHAEANSPSEARKMLREQSLTTLFSAQEKSDKTAVKEAGMTREIRQAVSVVTEGSPASEPEFMKEELVKGLMIEPSVETIDPPRHEKETEYNPFTGMYEQPLLKVFA